jgi:hypothetical protein
MKRRKTKEEKRVERQETLNQVNMVWDKIAEKDKKKKEKVKRSTPKSYTMRRTGAVIGWCVIISAGIFSYTNIVKEDATAKEIKAPIVQVKKENPATSQAAVQFAKDFASTYFTWDTKDEAKNTRREQLSNYLAVGLDEDAGLNMDQIKTASVFKEAKVKNVENIGQNKAKIVLNVAYEITTIPEQKEATVPKPGAKPAPPPSPEKKETTKTIVVPVRFDGTSYGIYELPTFTTVPEQTTLVAEVENKMTKATDTIAVQNITNFLDTFFESYSQDGKDKLSYILEDTKYQDGLKKSMNFVKVEESSIYEGKRKNQYIVDCKVEFADPDSESQFLTDYRLTVEQRGDHYVVTKIN